MTRPSRETDRRLIQAARKIIAEVGCTGLRLREVAKAAGVNLGMFSYHFKGRDDFLRHVLQEIYEEVFARLELKSISGKTSSECLRSVLIGMAMWIRENRKLASLLARDVINGDAVVSKWVRDNFRRHFQLILSLIEEGQKTGSLAKVKPINALVTLVGSANGPIVILTLLAMTPKRLERKLLAALEYAVLSDESILERIDIMMKGLRAEGKP